MTTPVMTVQPDRTDTGVLEGLFRRVRFKRAATSQVDDFTQFSESLSWADDGPTTRLKGWQNLDYWVFWLWMQKTRSWEEAESTLIDGGRIPYWSSNGEIEVALNSSCVPTAGVTSPLFLNIPALTPDEIAAGRTTAVDAVKVRHISQWITGRKLREGTKSGIRMHDQFIAPKTITDGDCGPMSGRAAEFRGAAAFAQAAELWGKTTQKLDGLRTRAKRADLSQRDCWELVTEPHKATPRSLMLWVCGEASGDPEDTTTDSGQAFVEACKYMLPQFWDGGEDPFSFIWTEVRDWLKSADPEGECGLYDPSWPDPEADPNFWRAKWQDFDFVKVAEALFAVQVHFEGRPSLRSAWRAHDFAPLLGSTGTAEKVRLGTEGPWVDARLVDPPDDDKVSPLAQYQKRLATVNSIVASAYDHGNPELVRKDTQGAVRSGSITNKVGSLIYQRVQLEGNPLGWAWGIVDFLAVGDFNLLFVKPDRLQFCAFVTGIAMALKPGSAAWILGLIALSMSMLLLPLAYRTSLRGVGRVAFPKGKLVFLAIWWLVLLAIGLVGQPFLSWAVAPVTALVLVAVVAKDTKMLTLNRDSVVCLGTSLAISIVLWVAAGAGLGLIGLDIAPKATGMINQVQTQMSLGFGSW